MPALVKLYPPTIGASLPAFYSDGNGTGTATIAVPFSMSRAVDVSNIRGFRLKVKTAQTNTFLKTLTCEDVENSISNRVVVFNWNLDESNNPIKVGQYLKVQLAYVANDGTVDGTSGYFSTVAVVKYTGKPTIYIEEAQRENISEIPVFKKYYTGVYKPETDPSERPYSYCFYLYDRNQGLVESSGWLLHNTSVNKVDDAKASLTLSQTIDTYEYKTTLKLNDEYYLQYGVRTINNLEIYTPLYSVIDPETATPNIGVSLKAENIFEEGYVGLHFEKDEDNDDERLDKPVSFEICRCIYRDQESDKDWRVLRKTYFADYESLLAWSFKDFTIEQGITYQYCFRQYNINSIASEREETDPVLADFEDMFLWDGERQLKIRFNPKVTSFKTTRLEQKLDTIGSKFPYIFRNGVVSYKEFPIAGLISYLADNNELFMNHLDELGILMRNQPVYRDGVPSALTAYEKSETQSLVDYNFRAERQFKLKLLEWLGNGKVKYFKSPTEGNYLVRLMNISLTPEDKLSRMLHTFSCTAYEIEEMSYENLVNLGFIRIEEGTELIETISGINLYEKVSQYYLGDGESQGHSLQTSVKINDYDIYYSIDFSVPAALTNFSLWLRIGKDNVDSKVLIHSDFFLKSNDRIPDVYFNFQDNRELLGVNTVSALYDFLAGVIINYQYIAEKVAVGDFRNIDNVYIQNVIKTFYGSNTISFLDTSRTVNGQEEVTQHTKIFVLDFNPKTIRTLYSYNNTLYLDSNHEQVVSISQLDKFSIYLVKNDGNYVSYLISDGGSNFPDSPTNISSDSPLTTLSAAKNYLFSGNSPILSRKVEITLNRSNEVVEFDLGNDGASPLLNLGDTYYKQIRIGNAVYLNCAYQKKVTTYNPVVSQGE